MQINPYGKPFEGTANEFGLKVMEFIKNMTPADVHDINVGNKCGECSRRKWYQNGYKDGQEVSKWIPVSEGLPANDNFVLLSFSNFSLPMIGRYERDEDGGGAWYLGDCDEEDTCTANDLFVNAWMALPELYKGE